MWNFRQHVSLSKIQTVVGLTAGILSITFSLAAFFRPASNKAELVAIVQDGKTEKALSDAVVEVLTPSDALVATLTPDGSGKARYKLEEGRYRLRVTHPHYRPEVRDLQLASKESTEIRVQMRADALDPVRRLFHR
jgi:carboxypeptidase family protein